MRISMWMLASWLEKYDPKIHIRSGKRILRNARMFSDEIELSDSTVYLEQTQSDRVLCSNGHDYLILRAEDVHEVFNDILDAFDYYNDCTGDALELIQRGCGARELLEYFSRILDRVLILADAGFYMREIVGPPALLQSLPSLSALQERMLPHEVLKTLCTLEGIRVAGEPSYVLDLPGIRPSAAVTNLFARGMHKGWLITLNASGKYSHSDLDLQDHFSDLVSLWLEGVQEDHMEKAGIFLDLLRNGDAAELHAEDRLRSFGWYPPDRKLLYTIRETVPGQDPMHALTRYLEALNPAAFVVRYEGRILYILNLHLTPAERTEEELRQILLRCGCVAGKSPVFTELSAFSDAVSYSRIAADYSPCPPGGISSYPDTALPYLKALLQRSCPVDPRHPALSVLSDYDASHDACLNETLRTLLEHNCNFTETAAALFIHRSTLLYRLSRIRELTGLELSEYDQRFYLQISYLLTE